MTLGSYTDTMRIKVKSCNFDLDLTYWPVCPFMKTQTLRSWLLKNWQIAFKGKQKQLFRTASSASVIKLIDWVVPSDDACGSKSTFSCEQQHKQRRYELGSTKSFVPNLKLTSALFRLCFVKRSASRAPHEQTGWFPSADKSHFTLYI